VGEDQERIQQMLDSESQRKRGTTNKGRSPTDLAGKLYDQNGVPLAPTYTMKRGRCYSYYVSGNKAVFERDEKGTKRLEWRLPSKQIERQLSDAIINHLTSRRTRLLANRETRIEDYQHLNATLKALQDNESYGFTKDKIGNLNASPATKTSPKKQEEVLGTVKKAKLDSGTIAIALESAKLADFLNVDKALIRSSELNFQLPFTQRKRGVEHKILLSNTARSPDPILTRNLSAAHTYLARVQQGFSLDEIATAYDTKTQRVRELIKIALLAPDITEALVAGEASPSITSDTLLKNSWPINWVEQRQKLAGLSR